jgi:hypothetical protein
MICCDVRFVRKEKISSIIKKAVSKIDTGIRPTRLTTLRAQRYEDEAEEKQ